MTSKNQTSQAGSSKEIGLLGPDTVFEGSIRFAGTLRVDGQVEGGVHAPRNSGSVLVINRQASIKGDITADQVLISGTVEGDVVATERVEIFKTGKLQGDIYTRKIMIQAGALFSGECHMDEFPEPVAEAQATGTQAVATQAVATQAVATQAVATQAVATQAVATQAAATQAAATQAVSTQTIPEPVPVSAVGSSKHLRKAGRKKHKQERSPAPT
ncbi:MAG: polymer-forming cytoskeletal protein [Deltaproteobacteria bacterium]|nr:polymer-forming cytoskeletal protein [Deltaproteobacteria bacterium]